MSLYPSMIVSMPFFIFVSCKLHTSTLYFTMSSFSCLCLYSFAIPRMLKLPIFKLFFDFMINSEWKRFLIKISQSMSISNVIIDTLNNELHSQEHSQSGVTHSSNFQLCNYPILISSESYAICNSPTLIWLESYVNIEFFHWYFSIFSLVLYVIFVWSDSYALCFTSF